MPADRTPTTPTRPWPIPGNDDITDPGVGRSTRPGVSRRRFMAGAAGAGAAGIAAVALSRNSWRRLLSPQPPTQTLTTGKGILVMVTLYGGNDGLNTVIPYQDSAYLQGRPTLGYKPDQVLPLADGLAFHPDLKGMKALWDSKQLAVVRGVGYPNPVLSHFRGMDIWQTASPDTPVATGVLGRWLDATGTDPMRAISVGNTLPRLVTGERSSGTAVTGGSITLPGGSTLAPVLASFDAPGPDRSGLAALVAQSGADLLHVQHTLADLLPGSTVGAKRGAAPRATPPGPTGSATGVAGGAGASKRAGKGAAAAGLAGELDVVAQLIKAGSPTRVYQVSMGGFDNHAQEKDIHARLMAELDAGVSGFTAALKGHPAGSQVVLMTYSEFGRRVAQNLSGGTDHGTAAPLFVVGQAVKGGQFYGAEPSLVDLDNGNLKFTTDFRRVFATMLADVIGVDPKVALAGSYPTLKLL
ncbi:MAG: DUF1501 domain-containing protein [Actinomycetota bacterium]|nr:DUF1501 domain-containing protein [Actinomycetota bacterium]